ncbi:MAG: cytochrome c5 family protein [Gammaproteobacteria bacterium]|nr:cytochrome c5 family protein [Gammaproteobacteria bacterium]
MKKVVTTVVLALGVMGTAAAADTAAGQKIYQQACFACHGTGAAGAPKVGDKAAWEARLAKGMDTLNKHAIEGFQGKSGFMPAKGGWANLSDADVKNAVSYMVENSK